MNFSGITAGRVLWLICAWLLLLPHAAAAAEPSLAADFDGDGRRDYVLVDDATPSVVRIWLSASNTTQVIHAGTRLTAVVAADLDGDRVPELIGRGAGLRLHVWTSGRGAFQPYQPRPGGHPATNPSSQRGVDEIDMKGAAAVVTTGACPCALEACAACPPCAPAPRCARGGRSARPLKTPLSADPFFPRPPPSRAVR